MVENLERGVTMSNNIQTDVGITNVNKIGVVILAHESVQTYDIKHSDLQRLRVLLKNTDGKYSIPVVEVAVDKKFSDIVSDIVDSKGGTLVEQVKTYGDDLTVVNSERTIMTSYMSLVKSEDIKVKDGFGWYVVSTSRNEDGTVNSIELRDSHGKAMDVEPESLGVVEDTLNKISAEVMEGAHVKALIPEEFTLREAQDMYELLRGKRIPSIRRFVEGKVVPTGTKTGGYGYRPSEIYTWE